MKLYIDTEFTDLVGIEHDIQLISIGVVAEDGSEFYVELTGHYQSSECSAFVQEAVLPHMDPAQHGKSPRDAALSLAEWVFSLGDECILATDSVGYDFGLVAELLLEHQCWPATLAHDASVINREEVAARIEGYFQRNPSSIRHHALWDARALAAACRELL